MKLADIHTNPDNPRLIKDEKFKKLVSSLKDFPKMMELRPIVVDKNMMILGGNMRYKALQELGNTEIPDNWVKIADKLTDEEKKRFIVEDNLPFGEWDWDILANTFEIDDLLEWGFDEKDLKIERDIEEDEVPEIDEGEPDSKLGEVYELGRHRLMCGDATKIEDVEKLMNGQTIKTIFTSPPYNMGADMYENYEDNLKSQEYIDFNLETIHLWNKYLEGYLFWNISYNKNARWEFLEIMYRIIKETGLRFLEMIVWDKAHGTPITSKDMLTREYEDILLVGTEQQIQRDIDLLYVGTKYKRANFFKTKFTGTTNYWRVVPNKIQRKDHLAIYPVTLPAKGIFLTTQEKDIVADPFGGSGSTLIACEQTNRTCYMMELDPKYCDVIRKRYENYRTR